MAVMVKETTPCNPLFLTNVPSIDNLLKIRAISMHNDGTFSPDDSCHVMSRNFIEFDAMKAIVKLPHDAGPLQLLHMMSNCAKIQTPVKRNEKKALNEATRRNKYQARRPTEQDSNSDCCREVLCDDRSVFQ